MRVDSFNFSPPGPCGIEIFSSHLRQALSLLDISVIETNLRNSPDAVLGDTSIVHYAPSAFGNPPASQALFKLMSSARRHQRLFVVLHGLHRFGETRLLSDTLCPDQERHIRMMLHTAEAIFALSASAVESCRTWQVRFGGRACLRRLDHPGLFRPADCATNVGSYALVGGISRSKKNHLTSHIRELVVECESRGIRVWEHWTNVPDSPSPRAWRQTSGQLNDIEWRDAVSNARVVLCPYETRVQSVSGIVSEAISAQRFVLATGFDLAIEMQRRVSALLLIEDDLRRWPCLIHQFPPFKNVSTGIPTWDAFARNIALEVNSSNPVADRAAKDVSDNQAVRIVR